MPFRFIGAARTLTGKSLFMVSKRLVPSLRGGVLAFLLIGVSAARAGPVFTANVGYADAGYPTLDNHGPTAVEATLSSSIPSAGGTDTKNEFAAAGPSGVRASARVTLSAAYSGSIAVLAGPADTGFAHAKLQLDDLRFRGVNGDRSGSTLASLNLDLSGTFLTDVNAFFDPGPGNIYGASARTFTSVGVSVSVPNVLGGAGQGQSFSYFQNRDTLGTFIGSLFDSGRITTQPFSFYNGIDNQIVIDLSVRVQGDAGGRSTSFDAFADAFVDFSHTVSFATSGPVFNIPDGYSVNSAEGQITGNSFVPEPSRLLLMASFAGVLIIRPKHQRSKRERLWGDGACARLVFG